jgi:hypothetical protein
MVSGGARGMQTLPDGALETGMRLVRMSGFSLAELADMDDLTVTDILDGLTARGRCGIGAEQRYVARQDRGAGRHAF